MYKYPAYMGEMGSINASVANMVVCNGDMARTVNIDTLLAGVIEVEAIDDDVGSSLTTETCVIGAVGGCLASRLR